MPLAGKRSPQAVDVDSCPLPPLRVHHFLLWTVCATVLFTVSNALEVPGTEYYDETRPRTAITDGACSDTGRIGWVLLALCFR